MASLAGLLQLEGHRITGSDKAAYPPMSDLLRELGIPVMEPYAAENLDPAPDLVVIGNALSRGNPEVERVLDERIPFTSMAALLQEEFLAGRESLVVAGTHGKTTTTSMLAWIYQTAAKENGALEPSFLIGGVAENFGSSFQLRPTRTFIVEGDEYDTAFFDKGPKFLHYFPDALILTHVEFDHADIYADLDAVKTAFKRLVNLVPRRGVIVAFDGSDNVSECVAHAFCRVERYGFSEHAQWQLRNLAPRGRPHPMGGVAQRRAVGRFGDAACGRAQRAERHRRGRAGRRPGHRQRRDCCGARELQEREAAAGGARRNWRRNHHRRFCASSYGDSRNAAGACARCIQMRVCGRCWSRVRTRCGARCSRPSWWTACAWLIAWCWPASTSSNALRRASGCIRRTWSARSTPWARRHRSAPMSNAILNELVPQLRRGDVVAILSNGGFDGIYEKLPARLARDQPQRHA